MQLCGVARTRRAAVLPILRRCAGTGCLQLVAALSSHGSSSPAWRTPARSVATLTLTTGATKIKRLFEQHAARPPRLSGCRDRHRTTVRSNSRSMLPVLRSLDDGIGTVGQSL